MTVQFKAAAKKGDAATITMMGEVGWDFGPADVSAALKQADGAPVDVEIFSYGGDAFAGLAIYEQLRSYAAAVTTRVVGIAASAASAILMGGSRRIVPANGAVMIHPCWSLAVGSGDEMRKTAAVLDKINEAYLSTYAAATGRPAGEIRPYLMEESWLFGEEAFGLSLATEVGEDVAAMAIHASISPERFRAMPEKLQALVASAPVAAAEPEPEPAAAAVPEPEPAADPEPPAPVEPEPVALGSLNPVPQPAVVSMTAINAARDDERNRQTAIRSMAKRAAESGAKSDAAESLGEKFCAEGTSVDEAREQFFDLMTNGAAKRASAALTDVGAGNIGMSQAELESYSVVNLINHMVEKTPESAARVGLELEASRAAAQMPGQKPSDGGILIPQDVLRSRVRGGWGGKSIRAAGQEIGDFSKGGALVDTTYLAGSFIDEVYVRSAIMRTGMTMLTGLSGPVTIGKQLSGSTTFWVGENVDVDESELAFGLTGLNPKTLGVRVPFSRMALKYTNPDIEMLARRDMSIKMALGIDKAFLYGTGSASQPLGLANHTGLAGVTFGGGASLVYPAKVGGGTHDTGDWADYVALEGQIASEELDVSSMQYLMNSTTRSGCKTTLRAAAAGSDYVMNDAGQINGYGAIVSNQLQTNDVIFGNFADALGAMFGALDLVVDNLTQSAKGQVIITMFQDVDFGVRYLESFVKGS